MYERSIADTLKFLSTRPEALDAALYIRIERLKLRIKEQPSNIAIGADIPPSECSLCRPDELCSAHELLDIAEEYRKRWIDS